MGMEYEWKFRATKQVLSAIDKAFPDHTIRLCMESTYYDTPDGALSARHYTLRKRLENDLSVCTLKIPAENGRGEWETECEHIDDAIAKLVSLGAPKDLPLLIQAGLIPVCGAKFTRLAKTILLPAGVLELALDEGCLFGGSKEIPLCEVEIELKSGATALCDRFAEDLAAQFSLVQESASKFRRGFSLYKGE